MIQLSGLCDRFFFEEKMKLFYFEYLPEEKSLLHWCLGTEDEVKEYWKEQKYKNKFYWLGIVKELVR